MGFQFAGPEVIEEKQGLGTEHGDIVHAVIDQILANGVVAVHGERDLEFGPHPVGAGNQHRLLILAGIEGEQAAKAAHFAEDLLAVGRRQQLRQRRFHAVTQINIHPGFCVCFL